MSMEYGIQINDRLQITHVELPSKDEKCNCILTVGYGGSHFRTPCMVMVGSPMPSVGDILLVKMINENDGSISSELLVNQQSVGYGYTLLGLTEIQSRAESTP